MKILLADGSLEVRKALRLVLEQAGHRVIREVADVVGLVTEVAVICPDVVVLDIDLPGVHSGRRQAASAWIELLGTLHRLCPPAKWVFLSSRPESRNDSLAGCADAFFCKSDPPDALLARLDGL